MVRHPAYNPRVVAQGTYVLVLALRRDTPITVGRLGTFSFPRGFYTYFGSALGGLPPRVRRHFSGGGRLRWHIDYLRREAEVVEAWYALSARRLECDWARAASTIPGARVPASGFGSSDCRCPSHLLHFTTRPRFEEFRGLPGVAGIDVGRLFPDRSAEGISPGRG